MLAPWPFLDGGAAAVSVAMIFDGATVEQEYLWRGGAVEARDPSGTLMVRRGRDGFEVVLPRACRGEIAVGARVVDLRELSLCGVAAVPVGPRTRVTLRAGAVSFVVTGTTAPRRLRLQPSGSWRRRTALAATAVMLALCALALQTATPRKLEWRLPEIVRTRVALLASQGGGRTAATARIALEPPRARSRASEAAPSAAARAKANASARTKTGARTNAHAKKKAEAETNANDETSRDAETNAEAKTAVAAKANAEAKTAAEAKANAEAETAAAAQTSAEADSRADARAPSKSAAAAEAAAVTPSCSAAEAASPTVAASPTTADSPSSGDDARQAAAVRARAAGTIGALAQWRAALLGDLRRAGADRSTVGAIGAATGGSDADARGTETGSSAAGATRSGSAGGSGSSAGGRSGSSAGGSGTGAGGGGSGGAFGSSGTSGSAAGGGGGGGDAALAGDAAGDAYGLGGLGLVGGGVGGGGADETIGLGDIGTIGHGGGGGDGVGYGYGAGRLGAHHTADVFVLPGRAHVRGVCDGELIRRVVRAHVNEVRFCFERALQAHPTLSGRVVTRFSVERDGRVSAASVLSSTIAAGVDRCVAAAIPRWQFARCDGVVTYPFVFVPAAR